ncbi:MAG: single-stranded-DNA-specific exonuclease RecJ [Deltaproteobacteria bacterium]|nr:single-stranded-DNA-specific exonuclease RecJ [Deltaproteobacteria bacterium]
MARPRWKILPAPPDALVRKLVEDGFPPLAATVLAQRGYSDPDAIADYLQPRLSSLPSPDALAGLGSASLLIADAIQSGRRICVYGDYDVDGTTATSLLVDFITRAGFPIEYLIPNRFESGYGFHAHLVEDLAARGIGLVITVDTGITGHEACARARKLGVRTIITDHHEIGDALPDADAIINPHQAGCEFGDHHLTGVGLAFFLAAGVRAELDRRGMARRDDLDLRPMLDLVALGTIADMAPVNGINRPLVSTGLRLLGEETRLGIKALKAAAGMAGKSMEYGSVSFGLAPRLNAAGRMAHAGEVVRLLTTEDPEIANAIAKDLDAENARRQQVEHAIHEQARKQVLANPHGDKLRSLVLAGENWHAGVIGIVAGRVLEEFYRPCIVIAFDGDVGKGSGRSVRGFDLHAALAACAPHLIQFGGHRMAAGLSVERARLFDFMSAFERYARANLRDEDLVPELDIVAECRIGDIDERTAARIEAMAPFGIGNPMPVFAARNVRVIDKRLMKEQHLRLRLADGAKVVTAMGWRMADRFGEIGDSADVAFQIGFNTWNGRRELQLTIKDIL